MPQQCQYSTFLWQIECNFSSASEAAAVASFSSLVLASVYRFDPWSGIPSPLVALTNENASLATSKHRQFADASRISSSASFTVADKPFFSEMSDAPVPKSAASHDSARIPDSSEDKANSKFVAAVESVDATFTTNKPFANAAKLDYPKPSSSSTCAIFTVVRDEPVLLPIWLRYYLKHASSSDLLVLDHATSDNSTALLAAAADVAVVQLRGDPAFSPHFYLVEQVRRTTFIRTNNRYLEQKYATDGN